MGAERGAAAGAVGDDFKALIEQALVPNLFEGPPLGLNKAVVIGNIGVVHVSPKADGLGEVLPHALIFPHALLALRDKGGNAVLLNLLLAVNVQKLFHLQLHRQAVGVPAGLAGHHFSLHGLIAGKQVLKGAGFGVADVGLAVGGGGAVIKGIGGAVLSSLHTLFKNVVLRPELFHCLFPLHEIHVRGDLPVLAHIHHPFHKKASVPNGTKACFALPPISLSINSSPVTAGPGLPTKEHGKAGPYSARDSGGMHTPRAPPVRTNHRLSEAIGAACLSPSQSLWCMLFALL